MTLYEIAMTGLVTVFPLPFPQKKDEYVTKIASCGKGPSYVDVKKITIEVWKKDEVIVDLSYQNGIINFYHSGFMEHTQFKKYLTVCVSYVMCVYFTVCNILCAQDVTFFNYMYVR